MDQDLKLLVIDDIIFRTTSRSVANRKPCPLKGDPILFSESPNMKVVKNHVRLIQIVRPLLQELHLTFIQRACGAEVKGFIGVDM